MAGAGVGDDPRHVGVGTPAGHVVDDRRPDAERALTVAQRCQRALGPAGGARVRVLPLVWLVLHFLYDVVKASVLVSVVVLRRRPVRNDTPAGGIGDEQAGLS